MTEKVSIDDLEKAERIKAGSEKLARFIGKVLGYGLLTAFFAFVVWCFFSNWLAALIVYGTLTLVLGFISWMTAWNNADKTIENAKKFGVTNE